MRAPLTAAVAGLTFGAYFILRYNGLWIDSDTTQFAKFIGEVVTTAAINPEGYRNGYAYPTWAAMLVQLSGLDILPLLQRYTPLVGNLFLALFSFATFRRWLASDRLGLAAAVSMFLVPELLFTVSRGNHEKLTTSLTLLAALALFKIYEEIHRRQRWRVMAGWTLTFYLVCFSLVSLNVLFGSSFIVASTISLIFALLFSRFAADVGRRLHPISSRLVVVVATAWTLVLLVMFHVYPYASENMDLLNTAVEKVGALFLSLEPSSDPYRAAVASWTNPKTYQLISSFRWTMFAISFVTWLVLLVRFFRKPDRPPLNQILMIAFYGGFGFQLALAIPVDLVGLSAGSNLQVRLYTYFSLFAVPLMVLGIAKALGVLAKWVPPVVLASSLTMVAVFFASVSVLKATLDPMVSNQWFFYQDAELLAIEFWDTRQTFDRIWIGPTTRALYPYRALKGEDSVSGNVFRRSPDFDLAFQSHALFSPVIYSEAIIYRVPVPGVVLENRVYDNGDAQIFHRLPRTPFQR